MSARTILTGPANPARKALMRFFDYLLMLSGYIEEKLPDFSTM